MNKKIKAAAFWSVAAAAAFALNGCYSYTPVQQSMVGNSFTERNLSKSNDMFANMKYLSLNQAQEIAVLNNPSYISAYHAVNAAKMRYYQSLGQFAPTISASFSMQQGHNAYYNKKNYNSGGNRNFNTSSGINASWLLFDGLSRYFQAMAYKHNYDYTVDMEENSRRLLMQAVAYAYNDILLAKAERGIAISNRDFQMVNLEATRTKLTAGAVAQSELLNFQIKTNEAISAQIAAEYSYDQAIFTLAALMGYSDGVLPANVEFDDVAVNLDEPISSIDVYLDTALNNRPDLQAYREAVESSKYSLYNTYSTFSPTVTGNVGFDLNTNSAKNYGYTSKKGSITSTTDASRSYYNNAAFSYGLSANWVLFNGGQRYNAVREAQATLAGSEFDLASQWLTVVQEVRTAYANYVASVKQARVYAMDLSLVKEQRDLVQIEYDTGSVALPRLNEAQTDYVTAEMNHAAALVSIQNAKAQLIAATNIDSTGYNFDDRYAQGLTPVDPQVVAEVEATAESAE